MGAMTVAATALRASPRHFNNAVHALRACATMMVFGAHMLDSFNTYFFPHSESLNLAMPYVKRFGTFGVELFFVISGYVIMNSVSRYDLRNFMARRMIRIYPVFAFFTLLFFALNWFFHRFPDKTSFSDLLLNITFLDIYFGTPALSPNAWSLSFEASFYFLAGLGCYLLRQRLVAFLVLLLLAASAFLATFPIAAYFVVGCLLYFVRDFRPPAIPRSLQVTTGIAWIALAAIVDRHPGPLDFWSASTNIVLLVATTAFFFVACCGSGAFTRLASLKLVFFIGTISYSFYLAHPYAYFPLRVLYQKCDLGSLNMGAAAALYFPSMIAVAVALSYAVHRLLEVAPYQLAFHETVFKQRSAAESRATAAYPADQTYSHAGGTRLHADQKSNHARSASEIKAQCIGNLADH
jgi:peptidoglycan/LPS O-acetylase OafA/YrhL